MNALIARLRLTETDESAKIGLAFVPAPEDVFISTYPKCGTTWVSFILHSLRSKGNMEFSEITEVVPWERCAHDCGQNLNDPQNYYPRLFKSHESFATVPKGGKYVYVARNPLEVVISKYEFLLSVAKMTVDDVPFEEFFTKSFLGGRGRIWEHYLSFIEQKDNPNVLWMFYEDLLEDREQCIIKLAAFAGISLDDELKGIVMHQSAFQFMKEHNDQFDDHFVLGFGWKRINATLPEADRIDLSDARANKVNKGGGREKAPRLKLSDTQIQAMNDAWTEVIGATTGIKSYADLRATLSPISM